MMVLIRGNDTLYDTDDYEEIQRTFDTYIYGGHRGEDTHNDKKMFQEYTWEYESSFLRNINEYKSKRLYNGKVVKV